jgi:hypothetical protein
MGSRSAQRNNPVDTASAPMVGEHVTPNDPPTPPRASTTVRTGRAPSAASGRTERKRTITRWNRRLGVALVVVFPLSYLTSWLHDQH